MKKKYWRCPNMLPQLGTYFEIVDRQRVLLSTPPNTLDFGIKSQRLKVTRPKVELGKYNVDYSRTLGQITKKTDHLHVHLITTIQNLLWSNLQGSNWFKRKAVDLQQQEGGKGYSFECYIYMQLSPNIFKSIYGK